MGLQVRNTGEMLPLKIEDYGSVLRKHIFNTCYNLRAALDHNLDGRSFGKWTNRHLGSFVARFIRAALVRDDIESHFKDQSSSTLTPKP